MRITENTIKSITVRISKREMWENFMDSMADITYDNGYTLWHESAKSMNDVAYVLLQPKSSTSALRKLFNDGWTVCLLGDAMPRIDNPSLHRTVVVMDGDNDEVVINHEDINF